MKVSRGIEAEEVECRQMEKLPLTERATTVLTHIKSSIGASDFCHFPEWKPAIYRNENLPFAGMETCHLPEWIL